MPKGIDQGNCNKEGLAELNKFQADILEHKEPLTHGHAFYYSEATGDIIRELTKPVCWFSKDYIREKMRRLNSINEFVGQEELEKCQAFMNESQLNMLKKGGQFYEKLEKFENLIETTEFPDSDYMRKEVIKKAAELQKDIVKWEMYYKGSFATKKSINKFLSDMKLVFKED